MHFGIKCKKHARHVKICYGNIGVFGDKYLGQNSVLHLDSYRQTTKSTCFPSQFLYRTFPGKIIHHRNTITEYMCLFCKQIAWRQLLLTI